ncbi:MAG TPA: hypothetical protein VHC91_08520 [Trinickia sp.]|uniref:hypothetical protein n=1 Tax=Trinickia sp. TaxID=2571163 RepID=UPI002B9860EC|nr:hypothetical protein [Trinickia sp.]HVW50438.1 hypothetical protein [Trinickia sp.]
MEIDEIKTLFRIDIAHPSTRRIPKRRGETDSASSLISFDDLIARYSSHRRFAIVQETSFPYEVRFRKEGKLQSNADNVAWPRANKLASRKLLPVRKYEPAMLRSREAMAIIAQLGLNRESRS